MIEYGGMAQNGSYNHNRHGQSGRELLLTKKETEIQSQTKSEFRKTKVMFETKLVAGEGSPELKEKPFNIDVERFSSFTKICRATAWVIRFIKAEKEDKPFGSTEIY